MEQNRPIGANINLYAGTYLEQGKSGIQFNATRKSAIFNPYGIAIQEFLDKLTLYVLNSKKEIEHENNEMQPTGWRL